MSQNGSGNLYGVELYQPIHSKQPYGLTHSMKGDWSFVYIDPPYFKSDSLFESWGFQEVWEAKTAFSKIMDIVKRKKPVKESTIIKKFRGKEVQDHIPAILSYFIGQNVLEKSERGYINISAYLGKDTMDGLKTISLESGALVADFIGSSDLMAPFPRTTVGRNKVTAAEFRETHLFPQRN